MITTFLVCLIGVVASNCSTLHPNLEQLIPDMDPKYPVQQIDSKLLDQCAAMFFGDDWQGGFNTTLAKLCNNNEDWQKVISKY